MTSLTEKFDESGRSAKWSFRQLGGPKKTLELFGRFGPLGRARRGTVVKDGMRVAQERVFFSGDTPPTRSEFGLRFDDYEIHGRWSDRYLGTGVAIAKCREVKTFVADRQELLISWGDIVSAHGYIEQFLPEREGRGEIPWSMVLNIDWDNQVGRMPTDIPDERQPRDFMAEIRKALDEKTAKMANFPPTLKGSIADFINGVLGSLNGVSSSLANAADQINDLANAPFAALRGLRAAIGQFRTVLVKLHTTYDDFEANFALEVERADDVQSFLGFKADFSDGCYRALAVLAEMDRQAALAERGNIKQLYEAREGDTWESIAASTLGSSERAKDIREANGLESGQPPIVGTTYVIPR